MRIYKLILIFLLVPNITLAAGTPFYFDRNGNVVSDSKLAYDDPSQTIESQKPAFNSNGDPYGSTHQIIEIRHNDSQWNMAAEERANNNGGNIGIGNNPTTTSNAKGGNSASSSFSRGGNSSVNNSNTNSNSNTSSNTNNNSNYSNSNSSSRSQSYNRQNEEFVMH